MQPDEPWRDPANYQIGRRVRCHGCAQECRETHWGKWCFRCNVERIERINRAFEGLTT